MSDRAKNLNWIILIVALSFSAVIATIVTISEYQKHLSHKKFVRLTGIIKRIERKGEDKNLITVIANYQNNILEYRFTSNKEVEEKQLTLGLNPKNHKDFFIYGLEENHLVKAKESLVGFFIIVILILMSVIFKNKISNLEDNLFGHSS
jgi:hypothetical protein